MVSWSDVRAFYRRRARRLLPLYFTNVFFILAFIQPGTSPDDTLRSLSLFAALLPPTFDVYEFTRPYNLVLWSLSVEIWFCILMPILLRWRQRISLTHILLGALIVALVMGLPSSCISDIVNHSQFQGMRRLLKSIPAFLIGMTLAEAFVVNRQRDRRLPALPVGLIFTLTGCLLLDAVQQKLITTLLSPIAELVILTGFGLTVSGLLTTRHTFLISVLTNWPLRMIGMMCYSLYIWHMPAIAPLTPTLNIYRFIRYITLVFGLSFLSYRYIEFGWVTDIRRLLPRWHGWPSRQEHLGIVSR